MVTDNSTGSRTHSQLSSGILDSIVIVLCVITIVKTLILSLLIVTRHQLIKSKEQIAFLLSLNMYVATLIFAVLLLNMFIPMLKYHLDSDAPTAYGVTAWCVNIQFLLNMIISVILYSNALLALHRFFRIVHYTHSFFHQNIHLYVGGIFLTIPASALQSSSLLFMGAFEYEDYHCQILRFF